MKLHALGTVKPPQATLPNRNSRWKTVEEEKAGRQQAVEETVKIFQQLLPGLLQDFATTDAQVVTKKSRHAWLSSEPLHERNVQVRCNEMGRSRWGLENYILQEKRQGYQYEHVFAYDWNAMKGYHYLMHLAHFMNEWAGRVDVVAEFILEWGIRGFLRLLKETIAGPWLNHERIRILQEKVPRLQFVS
jgi:hypothetical protein